MRSSTSVLLDNVSLDADPGELIVVLGRSGAGKSTLLRALAGLVRSSGSVIVDGRDVSALPPQQRPVTMVLDRPALFPHMTVAENVRFAAPREQRTPQVTDAALLSLGIDHLGDRYPHQLSTGQQQKVGLARALVRLPTVMLFDEPLAHVDTYSSDLLKNQILHTHRRLGCTTFYVTHDIDEAFSVADRLLYLEKGRIIQDGSPQEFRERPATLEIARHLGASILLPSWGILREGRFGIPKACTRLLGQDLEIDVDEGKTGESGQIMVIGFPESASARLTGRRGQQLFDNRGQVISNTYMGAVHHVAIETILGRMLVYCSTTDELSNADVGDEVVINFDQGKLWALRL